MAASVADVSADRVRASSGYSAVQLVDDKCVRLLGLLCSATDRTPSRDSIATHP